jgi:hypothetical protein
MLKDLEASLQKLRQRVLAKEKLTRTKLDHSVADAK